MTAECLPAGDIAAFLAGELSSHEQQHFTLHLAECVHCRSAVQSSSRLLGRLQSLPEIEPSPNFAASVLQRIRTTPAPVHHLGPRVSRIAAIAAAVALCAGGAVLHYFTRPASPGFPAAALANSPASSVARALDWFCQHQEPDGSWDAEKWGGNRRFEVALTALPLIALLDGQSTPERAAAAQRALAYIGRQQNPDGTFGASFREAPYIQSVSTLALLRAYERRPSPELRQALDAALKIISLTQTRDGGWGYARSPVSNLAITLWHKDVVELACKLGWQELRPSVDRVHRWLEAQPVTKTLATEMTAGSGFDYHTAYFLTSHLRHEGTAESLHRLADLRQNLVSAQTQRGIESGTWNPSDQWSQSGGRIYSTAMASLSLR